MSKKRDFENGQQKDADQTASEGSFAEIPNIDSYDGGLDLSGLDVAAAGSLDQFLSEKGEYAQLPHPDVFNAYPPEVQRKIMEWTDRDVRARRDDESRRRDELMRAKVENDRRGQMFPTIITVLAIVAAGVTGFVTANPLFPLVFMLVPLAVIVTRAIADNNDSDKRNKPPRV